MLSLLGNLLGQDMHQPEHRDGDYWRNDEDHPGDDVRSGIERLALEHRGVGRCGVERGSHEDEAEDFNRVRRQWKLAG